MEEIDFWRIIFDPPLTPAFRHLARVHKRSRDYVKKYPDRKMYDFPWVVMLEDNTPGIPRIYMELISASTRKIAEDWLKIYLKSVRPYETYTIVHRRTLEEQR